MAHRNRKVDEEMVQQILLDDPAFLKEIVERVLQSGLDPHRRATPGQIGGQSASVASLDPARKLFAKWALSREIGSRGVDGH